MKGSVALYFGDEFLASHRASNTLDALVPQEDRVFGLEIIDGAVATVDDAIQAVRKCLSALQTVGFLASRKVVWFRDVGFLVENVTGKSTDVKDCLKDLAEMIRKGLPPGQVLLVTASDVDKRSAFFKACQSCGEIEEFFNAAKGKTGDQAKYALEMAERTIAEAGLQAAASVTSALAERVGADTRQMAMEVAKLGVALRGRKRVEVADVETHVFASRELPGWELADAFVKKQPSRAFRLVRQLLFQGQSAIGLVIVLENRIKELLVYREAIARRWLRESHARGGGSYEWVSLPPEDEKLLAAQLASDPRKMHPYRIGMVAKDAAGFTPARLVAALRSVVEAHEKLVSCSLPESVVLEVLMAKIMA